MHCTENHIFFFPDVLERWSFQKNCTGIWSFLFYRERLYLFFPKMKDELTKKKKKNKKKKEKNTGIWYLIQMFWKDDLFKKDWSSKLSFLYYQERWYFFPENMVFSPWTENEGGRTYLKKYIETWYFLLDIFHTVPEKKKSKTMLSCKNTPKGDRHSRSPP